MTLIGTVTGELGIFSTRLLSYSSIYMLMYLTYLPAYFVGGVRPVKTVSCHLCSINIAIELKT